jgi:flagellar FliL protein
MSDKAAHKETEEAAPAKSGGMMGQLKVGGIIATIVLIQCMMAYFLLPSAPTEAAAATGAHKKDASKKHGDDHGKGEHAKDEHGKEGDHHAAPESGEQREADLGKFSITSYDQASNSTILIDFHLYGAVFEEEKHEGDAPAADAHGGGHGGHGDSKKPGAEEEDSSKFGKLFKKSKHRFRDQVITIVRNSSPADRSDPALGLLKRQILAKTNSLLGEPLLKEVIFSEFSVVQQ